MMIATFFKAGKLKINVLNRFNRPVIFRTRRTILATRKIRNKEAMDAGNRPVCAIQDNMTKKQSNRFHES